MSRPTESTRTPARSRPRGALIAVVLLAAAGLGPAGHASGQAPPPGGAPPTPQLAVGLSVWSQPRQEYLDRAFDALRACRVPWIRVDFSWGMIEPAPGDRRWAYYDALVDRARRDDIRILGILAYAAPWATSDPTRASDKFPPSDLQAYASFAGAAAERYRGRVPAWEIWNEPDHPEFWHGTPAQYSALLARAHAAIKAADPDALVVLGGLAQGGGADPRFLELILSDPAHPAGRHFDVAAFHTNFKSMRTLRAALADNRALLRRFGAPQTVWITESAYTSDHAHQRLVGYGGGAAGQARYVRDLVDWARGDQVPFLSWAGLRDEPDAAAHDPYAAAGLIASDWRPKPALGALCAAPR